jgi:acyl-CoA dehydrogenase
MSDLEQLLDQVLGKEYAHAGESVDGSAWERLVETGLTRVGIPESSGGSGGDPRDAAAVTVRAAQAGLGVPLAETLFPVAYLAAKTFGTVPEGIITAVGLDTVSAVTVGGGIRFTASSTAVPWGAVADELWLLAPLGTGEVAFTRLPRDEWTAVSGTNLAGEPRDDVTVDAFVRGDRVVLLPINAVEELALTAALGRSCQLLGALRASLRLAAEYVVVRHQFRKPLAAHQAVRHALAGVAGEVAAAEAAVSQAVDYLPRPGSPFGASETLAIAAAKIQTSRGATRVARAAHQMLGALGVTAEHPLHHFSTRLWSWRDEAGSAAHWAGRVAELVRIEHRGDLWAALTSSENR